MQQVQLRTYTPEQVAEIYQVSNNTVYKMIKEVKPYGVDVSSGIESSPGKKNIELMERFIEEVRRAESSISV